MMDWLGVRVPADAPLSPKIADSLKELQYGSVGPVGPFRPSRFYRYVADLRDHHDSDAILHLGYRFGRVPDSHGTHKVEIVDCGKKTLPEMLDIIRRIFDVDPLSLELMRLDLAANIQGIAVSWFRNNARVQFKRFASRIEKATGRELEFISMGTAKAQSIYAGRRPDCFRIYDKIAEWHLQWRKLIRSRKRFNAGLAAFHLTDEQRYYGPLNLPTFEEFCRTEGFVYQEGSTLTRVERQIGDRFPHELKTVADLQKLPKFNPFDALKIVATGPVRCFTHVPDAVSMRNWLAARGLSALMDDYGDAQQATAFVLEHSNGNGKRVLDSLMPIMPPERTPVTVNEIRESYRKSVERQLVA